MSRARCFQSTLVLVSLITTAQASPVTAINNHDGFGATNGLILVVDTKKALVKKPSIKGGPTGGKTTVGSSALTAEECERLGGVVTGNGDPNCKSNQRCKTTLSNGDLRSVCIDEVK